MKRNYCLRAMLLPFLFSVQWLGAQNITLKGRVAATNQAAPVAGAAIFLLHSNKTVLTGKDGSFAITLTVPYDTLIVSHISYQTKRMAVNGNTTNLIIMLDEAMNQMGEVVVSTGYQNIPKERATGSFDIVDNTLFNRPVSSTVLSRIENVTPGVLFNKGDAAKTDPLLIRGRSTIYANAAPLIVVDNFPYDGDINNINPNDVENVTILKDAAAASIWGARAGNGVIVITTKKGKTSTPQLQLNTNMSFVQKPDLFNVSTISSADYIDLEKYLFDSGYYARDEQFDAWNFGHPPLTPVVELLIAKRDGTMTPAEADAKIASYKVFDARNDLEKYLYRTGINQQYAVNVSGNTPYINYYFSAGWDKSVSNLAGADNNRVTLRSQNIFKINSKLQFEAGANFIQNISRSGNNPGYYLNNGGGKALYPYAQLADENGNALALVKEFRTGFVHKAQENGLLDWQYKPLDDISANELTTKNTDYLLNAGMRYGINRDLQLELKYQYEQATIVTDDVHNKDSYFARNLINSFTQADATTGTLSYPVPLGGIMDVTNGSIRSHQGRVQLSYSKSWDNKHQLTALAGWEIKDLVQKSSRDRYYGYEADRSSANTQIDYVNQYTLYYNIYQKANISTPQALTQTTDRFISEYANAAYTFLNRYTFSASARQDAANLFGAKTNQKVTPLWSTGFAWQLNNEKFYHADWLPSLKLRMSYGYNGNISRLASGYTTVSFYGAYATPLTAATIITPPNSQLRWERVAMMNAAVDFVAKNRVVSGSIEYYRKHAKDLLGEAPIDPTIGLADYSGESFFYGNVAAIKGSGVDVMISTKNSDKKLKWQTDWIFSYSSSKVDDYLMPASSASSIYLQISSQYINPVKGRPVYSVYSYPWQGLVPLTGDPLGMYRGKASNDYGSIFEQSIDSIKYNGPAQPVYFGAVRNTFQWKNFSLSFNVSYKLGYYFRSVSVDYYSLFNTWTGHSDYALRWQKPGDEKNTSVPSLIYPDNPQRDLFYQYASVLVERADNVRLEDVSISYDLDKRAWHYLPFRHLRVYGYAANLGVLWRANKKQLDPYYNNVPEERKRFSLGVAIDF